MCRVYLPARKTPLLLLLLLPVSAFPSTIDRPRPSAVVSRFRKSTSVSAKTALAVSPLFLACECCRPTLAAVVLNAELKPSLGGRPDAAGIAVAFDTDTDTAYS